MPKWRKLHENFWEFKGEEIIAPSGLEIVEEEGEYYVMLRQARSRPFKRYGINEQLGEFDEREDAEFFVKNWMDNHPRGYEKTKEVS